MFFARVLHRMAEVKVEEPPTRDSLGSQSWLTGLFNLSQSFLIYKMDTTLYFIGDSEALLKLGLCCPSQRHWPTVTGQ